MMQNKPEKPTERQFPPIYEKLIPIAIIALIGLIVVTLIFTVGVAMGWLTF